MQRTSIILAYIFVCVNCFSQQYPFVHYTPREGLVNNKAKFVYQDSKGKLYISTYGGLSIYDGARFTNFNTNNGLRVNLINDIVEMGDDSIWLMPNDNIVQYIYKGQLKTFKPKEGFTPLINQLIKCSDGYCYAIADEGLFRVKDGRFEKILFDGLPGASSIKTLTQAVEINKKLYVLFNPDYKLEGNNLFVYDLLLNKLVALNNTVLANRLFNIPGKGLIAPTTKGLLMIDTLIPPDKKVQLRSIPASYHIPDQFPFSVYNDRQNNLWFASAIGVYRIKANGETTLFTTENGLTTNIQNSIFQDKENNMWFTNEQTGLSKLSNQQLAYYPQLKPEFTATDIYCNRFNDSIWMHDGYRHKLLLVLPNKQTKEWTNPNENLTAPARFYSANGKWMLSGGNIFRLTTNDKNYSLSLFYKDTVDPIAFDRIVSDKNGDLIAVSNKLFVMAGKKIFIEQLKYMADQVTLDDHDRIWTATRSDELFCFQLSETGDSTKLSLLQSYKDPIKGSPRSIAVDQKGNIWIGTRDQGIYCVYFEGLKIRSFKQLSTLNGLSDNFIGYLYCDKENNIWAGSPSGLDKITVEKDHFLIENVTRRNNLYFPILKIQQTKAGLFWILTGNGIILYDPVRTSNDWKPQLTFSNILVGNADQMRIVSGQELSHDQNNLSFQISAPTYIDEKQTRFSYLLEGSGNKNWSTPSTDASINFVNLPAGEYKLRAKAIFLHGLYPDVESSYSFTILPPWWLTWWFKLPVIIVLLVLAFLGVRFYIGRKLELQRADLEKRRALEKERTRIATDMHDDLGAGLSQIKFLSETIGMRRQKHLPIEEEIDSIRSFSHEMIDKMGEIVWALNEKNDTISDLLSYARSYAVEYLQQNGIACNVIEPDNIPQNYVSSEFRRNIYLTVKETLHNIVKHAEATEVKIVIEIDHSLNISIKDNGKGFDESSKRILGNGLINMRNRIEGLNGKFEIASNNNGTLIRISVPMDT